MELIHDPADQKEPQSTHGTLCKRKRKVRLRPLQRIEAHAIVDHLCCHPIFLGCHIDSNFVRAALRLSMHDHVRHHFFQCQVQIAHSLRRNTLLIRESGDLFSQPFNLRHVVSEEERHLWHLWQ
jgi:hypothetical protein